MATKREQYDAELLILKEKKKMHMITQDAYDQQQAALAKKYFGDETEEQA